ncbi:hypothetical protein M8J76_004631 [Diaphorina citri]|nr:hypothetical protein M8J76_004631 [Diaphorina citri]
MSTLHCTPHRRVVRVLRRRHVDAALHAAPPCRPRTTPATCRRCIARRTAVSSAYYAGDTSTLHCDVDVSLLEHDLE